MSSTRRAWTVWEQARWLERLLPGAMTYVGAARLDAYVKVQPTPIHQAYAIQITMRARGEPQIVVLSPSLQPRIPHEPIPHTYGPNEPCLYLPGSQQWAPWMLIATTIIPWANEWLWHYESWRATGYWDGGGIEHDASGPLLLGAAPGCYY